MLGSYWESTHLNNWTFEAGKKYADWIKKDFEEEEVEALLYNASSYIYDFCIMNEFSQKILEISLILFRRCYMQPQELHYPSIYIARTCVHLAAFYSGHRSTIEKQKAQKDHRTLEEIAGEKVNFPYEGYVWEDFRIHSEGLERAVARALQLDFNVYIPSKFLMQFVVDSCLPSRVSLRALEISMEILKTPYHLYHSPFVVALAALYIGSTEHDIDIREFLGSIDFDVDELLDLVEKYEEYQRTERTVLKNNVVLKEKKMYEEQLIKYEQLEKEKQEKHEYKPADILTEEKYNFMNDLLKEDYKENEERRSDILWFVHQAKEIIQASFRREVNNISYLLNRYKKNNVLNPFKIFMDDLSASLKDMKMIYDCLSKCINSRENSKIEEVKEQFQRKKREIEDKYNEKVKNKQRISTSYQANTEEMIVQTHFKSINVAYDVICKFARNRNSADVTKFINVLSLEINKTTKSLQKYAEWYNWVNTTF